MDEKTSTEKTRKTPGPAMFLVALFLYLSVVHVASILSVGPQPRVPALAAGSDMPTPAATLIDAILRASGHAPLVLEGISLLLLFGSMVTIFYLTRHLVKGPVWLGSLAAALFMAHPAKTEVLFTPLGLYQLCGAMLALMSLLCHLYHLEKPGLPRMVGSLVLFALATIPFAANAPLFCVLIMLGYFPGKPETRQWVHLLPFLAVAVLANSFHRDVLYSSFSSLSGHMGALLLLIYPIGLLPSTLHHLDTNPVVAWAWGAFAIAIVIISLRFVRSGSYRVCILAVLVYRFYPGSANIDLSNLHGAGQLLLPIALGCVAFAGFCRWLMQYEAWGKPVVVITTMICMVLFILQFQANRVQLRKPQIPSGPAIVARTLEGPNRA